MKPLLVVCAALLLVPVALAGAVRTVTAPAPVLALAFDGSRVAYASGRSATDCNRVFVWNLTTRGITKLGRKTNCEKTSTGNAISAVSIAGTRVLWLHYTGGNSRDWSLWTATPARPTPVPLRFVTIDADDRPPLVLGTGDDSRLGVLLPYAWADTVYVVGENGGRRFYWRASARVTSLAADDGKVFVASADGVVTVLDTRGRVLRRERFATEISAVRPVGGGILVQRGRTLELRDGGAPRTWTIQAGARLEDANETRAFFVAGKQLRQLVFATGAQSTLAAGTHVQAEQARVGTSSQRLVTVRALP